MQQATRLASRVRCNTASSIASTSYINASSLHTSSNNHASQVQWQEIPLPTLAPKSAASADEVTTTTTSSNSKSKRKGKGRPPSSRELPLRKQFLMEQYKQILSTNPVVVFLKPSDFSVEEITRLRVDLSLIPSTSTPASNTSQADEINSEQCKKPRFIYLRAGLLPLLFEQMPHLKSNALISHLSKNGNNIAALTLPSLDPPSLKAALKAINKLSKTPNVRKIQAEASKAAAAGIKPTPGGKKVEPPKEERLKVITALVEGKDMNSEEIVKLSNLPSLQDTLAQLVQLISTPANTIHSLLARAGGQDLARTLEGFKIALEEKEKGDKPSEA